MYAKINRLLFYLYRFLVKTDTPREGKPVCPSNMRGLNPRSSAWQADALPTKLMLHIGRARRIRTATWWILSPLSLPLEYCPIYKTFVFGLVAFASSAIPLYLAGEPRFELGSQLRPRGLDSFTKFNLQKKPLFIFYIYYIIFFIKNQIISYWLPLWDLNPDNLLQRDITVLETGVLPLDEAPI